LKRKKKKRVFVMGLDGVPCSLLLDLTSRGVMPATKKLIDSGHLHRMKASLPEISAVSWTDFMTGSNAGAHGIFGFTDLKKNSYDLRFPNFLDVKKDTFWDSLGQKGKRCVVINQPSTYPARKINGTLISGFVALEIEKAVYPLSLARQLKDMGYLIDIDTLKAREDHTFLWDDLSRTLEGREKAFEALWPEEWDYFEYVITGTDRLHHFLWNAYEDESHPYHQDFIAYYNRIDRNIDKAVTHFLELSDSLDNFFILSDHGFAAIKQEVYLNVWLEQQGYLKFETPSPQSLTDISFSSAAFALDPNRIYLNSRDKFPKGSVEESQKKTLKQEISDKLERLEYNNIRVVRKVYDAEEVYQGPYVAEGPDLIILSEYGFDMKGSVKKKETFGRTNLQGMHTWDDALFWSNSDQGQNLCISGLAPLILDRLL
jgi:predicted AlkP superfamily phosphohydrolase/phosphomutase